MDRANRGFPPDRNMCFNHALAFSEYSPSGCMVIRTLADFTHFRSHPMTEPITERFHRNANGPPDRDIRPIMRLRTSATVPLTACISKRPLSVVIFRKLSYDRTDYRAFSQEREWTPDRWHPPDRDMGPIMRLRTSGKVTLTACISERTRDYVRLQETIPYFKTISADLNLRTKELTAGRCSVVPLPKQIRIPPGSFNTFINKNNRAPISPIPRTMGQATGGRLL